MTTKRSILDLAPIPDGFTVAETGPHLLERGSGACCRFCGLGQEGTASHTIRHWAECPGVVAYWRARACGLDPETAVKLATILHRDLNVRPQDRLDDRSAEERNTEWWRRDFCADEAYKTGAWK